MAGLMMTATTERNEPMFDPTNPDTWSDADWSAAFAMEDTAATPVVGIWTIAEAA
jgi:hypothetical protein